MPTRIQLLGTVGLVVTLGLAATSGAASAPATGSRLAAASAQGSSKIAFLRGNELYVMNADGSGRQNMNVAAKVTIHHLRGEPRARPCRPRPR